MNPSTRRQFLHHSAGAALVASLDPHLLWAGPTRLGEPISVGVIGVGRQGRAMLAELQKIEGVTIAAICDITPGRLRSGARRAKGAASFESHGALLEGAKDIGAVFIATPTHTHKAIVSDALEAGKHVYCEAPLAHTIDDAKAIVKAARASDRVFQSGLLARVNPVYKLARKFAVSGSIRDWVSMRGQYCRKTSWRSPTKDPKLDAILNWRLDPDHSIGLAGECGTHQFDAFHWFLGAYPTEVRGGGSVRVHKDGRKVADTIHCELTFEGGLTALYEASLGSSYERTYELYRGSMSTFKLAWTHGWMFKEADAPTQGWEVYANRQVFHDDEGITLIADATKLQAQGKLKDGVGLPHPPLYFGIEAFLKSVTEGAPVQSTAGEGLRATAVGILANRAITTGTTQTIERELFKAE